MQVAAASISLMMRRQPALARKHLLHPLTLPLTLLTGGVCVRERERERERESCVCVCVSNLRLINAIPVVGTSLEDCQSDDFTGRIELCVKHLSRVRFSLRCS